MRKSRNFTIVVALVFGFAWVYGCGGCNPPPVPTSISPMEGPETGGTPVKITGEKFDMKKGAAVAFGGKNAQNVNVPSKTEITAVTPPGTAGQSVEIVVTSNSNTKPEGSVTMSQKFTYTDATPPTVTGTNPSDGTIVSDYEDSLNVTVPISITFSENVNSGTGSVTGSLVNTPDSLSQESGVLSGNVGGSGNAITFTPNQPMRAGRKYTVTVSGLKDTALAGNTLVGSHSFSFTTAAPKLVRRYQVRKGDRTLAIVAARPEVYDNGSREYQARLAVANQDDADFDPNNLPTGLWLWVPRQEDVVWKGK